ncbi:hypothetical protein SAMN05421820_10990 [Pedobacter steynii]|uniref:Uncharacterized protein n=1 Tax=Pedobacter steynii TaxID=430522 RepID=A0A1H0DS71_9SPHI|nr:hypothetical protein SAMN05421820_10990 [Pedobacter steynii]
MKKENFNEKQLLSRKDLKKVLGGDPGVTERDCPEGQYKHYCPGGFIGEDGIYQHMETDPVVAVVGLNQEQQLKIKNPFKHVEGIFFILYNHCATEGYFPVVYLGNPDRQAECLLPVLFGASSPNHVAWKHPLASLVCRQACCCRKSGRLQSQLFF